MDGKFWGKIAISAVILGLAIFAFNTFSTTPITKILLPPLQTSATAQEFRDTVLLTSSEIAVQEKGHLTRAAFAIDNSSNHDIKNIKIICTVMDDAGAEQGRDKWVIYDTIKAHANGVFSYTAEMYVSGKATSSQCRIVDMEIAKSPLIAIHRGSTEGHGGGHQPTEDVMHGGHH
ncbi:MAG: hypothetical protein KJ990_06145 [Proteobacteria bacterium]|nr:hypothetical protein [Pseudomonadota bacterium]MBU1648640.1 hypothetical protein [Pseudomonadota bacterium]